MKQSYKIFMVLMVWIGLIFCSACGDEMIDYEGEDGIYFEFKSASDKVKQIHFADYPSDTLFVVRNYQVNLLGHVTDYARPFAIKVCENDTLPAREGVDYIIENRSPVFKAGEVFANIQIKLIRTPGLLNHTRIFEVQLVENEHFSFLNPMYEDSHNKIANTSIIIEMDEYVAQPNWWKEYGEERFGRWTITKAALICDCLNILPNDWNRMEGRVTLAYLTYACIYMYRYLNEQEANGTPVYDEPLEGSSEPVLMKMGPLADEY